MSDVAGTIRCPACRKWITVFKSDFEPTIASSSDVRMPDRYNSSIRVLGWVSVTFQCRKCRAHLTFGGCTEATFGSFESEKDREAQFRMELDGFTEPPIGGLHVRTS